MNFIGIIIFVFLKILSTENRKLSYSYEAAEQGMEVLPPLNADRPLEDPIEDENQKVIGLKSNENSDDEPDADSNEITKKNKKPCAIVVLSSVQNPSMQSLLRRYRYDSNGILIPNSVKYFIKLPRGLRETPVLVPLNDKAFSPLGGFIRYYKEVPPIPLTW